MQQTPNRAVCVYAVALQLILVAPAVAHQLWADGSAIPEWVKESCCGPADAHMLDDGDVTLEADGYHVKDYPWVIPVSQALPSQDGHYWLFYATYYAYSDSSKPMKGAPICFFVPLGS